jgi:hypothetical protein
MFRFKKLLIPLATIYTMAMVVGIAVLSFNLYIDHQVENQDEARVLGVAEVQERLASQQEDTQILSPAEAFEPSSFTLTASWFGDVFWGRRVNRWSQESEQQYQFPFSGLDTFEKQADEHWIANLECPATTEQLTTYQEETILKFNCPVEYLPEARKHFDVFSLANNHTDNLEEVDGLRRTRENLEQHDFQYFGSYDNARQDEICEVVSLRLKVDFDMATMAEPYRIQDSESDSDPRLQAYYIPIALCGYHNVFKLPTQEELEEISRYSEHFITVVLPHQGAEYGPQSDNLQKEYYRRMIDLGADMVLGGHTHSVHETESYNGKLIVYSMGNFIFDQQFSTEVTRSIAVQTVFNFPDIQQVMDLQGFSEDCLKFQDQCLQKAQQQNIPKTGFDLDLQLIASQNDNRQARKAGPEITQALLERTRWESTVAQLEY